jgi:hypothetical protein
MREVHCKCGRVNRVRRFFVTRQARCRDCKTPLPEPPYIKPLRFVYRVRWWLPLTATMLFFAVVIVASWMLGLSCSAQKRPPHGLFARYRNYFASVPLTITSSPGSDYFVKITTTSGQPVSSFYIHGGENLTAMVPTGTFIIKHAVGVGWCGEQSLFGASTMIEEGTKSTTFFDDSGYTLRLTKRPDGNFPTRLISRTRF